MKKSYLSISAICILMLGALVGCDCSTKQSCDTHQKSEHHVAINTPDEAIAELKAGNARFVESKLSNTNFKEQIEATKGGQHPHSLVLTCLDSRVPPEIIFDQGIGNLFVARVAGNTEDANIVGSLEFATKIKHTKLIVVLGHSHCGAVEGAIANAQLGQLTQLLDQIKPAIVGDTTNKAQMVELTAKRNVTKTIEDILAASPTISEQVQKGEVKIVSAYYNIENGIVAFE